MKSNFDRLNPRHLGVDIFIIALSAYCSLLLRLGWIDFLNTVHVLNRLLPLFIFLRIVTMITMGVYNIIWRYISLNDAWTLQRAVLFSSISSMAITYLVDIGRIPRSTFLIDTILVTLLLGGIRLARRWVYDRDSRKILALSGRRTLIFGAGTNGRTLATRLNTDKLLNMKLFGFIDDDPSKMGRYVGGVKVIGSRLQIAEIIRDFQIQEVIIAVSSPSSQMLRELIETTQKFNIRPKLFSGPVSGLQNKRSFELFREIELADLLNRSKRNLDLRPLKKLIEGKKVLITGAGGSIGSELARQILALNPNQLILLDHSEFNLYQIDEELRTSATPQKQVIPILASIRDRVMLSSVFSQYLPEIVFHAAAYKHVHLVENNPYSSILNNIEGTQVLLDLSEKHQIQTFVQISTDKAVNPAGIMGATKRLCELLVSDTGYRTGLRFCSVRFGNVLGSSGSLIPLLHRQVQNREPITITDKDMSRYFMLITEAISLVLKAACISKPADISILKMGEPVRILDIARNLITLMGRNESEVPIFFTGMRPGEKLREELYLCGNELNTEDPDILLLPRGDTGVGFTNGGSRSLKERVQNIIDAAYQHRKEAVSELYLLTKKYIRPMVAPLPEDSVEKLPNTISPLLLMKPQLDTHVSE